jgi:hypothetical protein
MLLDMDFNPMQRGFLGSMLLRQLPDEPREQPTRSTNKDKACRYHGEDETEGWTRLRTPRRMMWMRMTTKPDRKDDRGLKEDDDDDDDDGWQLQDGTDWTITDKRTPWYWMTRVRPIIPSPLSAVR